MIDRDVRQISSRTPYDLIVSGRTLASMRGASFSPVIYVILIVSLLLLVPASFLPTTQAAHATIPGTLIIRTPFSNQQGIVTIDTQVFTTDPAGEVKLSVQPGTTKIVTVVPQVQQTAIIPGVPSGVQQVFSRWSDLNTANQRRVTMPDTDNANVTLAAIYNTQYFLQLSSEFGVPIGGGWHVASSVVSISVDSPVSESNGRRKAFSKWTGDISSDLNPATFDMNSPKLIKAIWSDQFELSIATQYGSPNGGGWYDIGTTVNINVQPIVDAEKGKRFVFIKWSDGVESSEPSIDVKVDRPISLTIVWMTQFFVFVESAYGEIDGADWYDAEANVTLSITPVLYADRSNGTTFTFDPGNNNGTRFIFDSWDGSSSSSNPEILFVMNEPKEFVAEWRNQYLTNFSFSNFYGNISVVPSELEFLGISGQLSDFSLKFSNSTLWLDRGTEWRLVSARWHDVDVSPRNESSIIFSVTKPSIVLGNLSIFNAQFNVVDSLGLPIEGAVTRLTLANGTEVEIVTDKYGSGELKLIPLGTFEGAATNLAQKGIIHAPEMGSNMIRTTIPVSIPVLFAAIVGIVVGVRFSMIILGWLHSGGFSLRRSRIDNDAHFCRFCGVGLLKHVKICPSCHQDLHYVATKSKVDPSQNVEKKVDPSQNVEKKVDPSQNGDQS